MKWGADNVLRGNEANPDSTVKAPVVFVGFGVVAGGSTTTTRDWR